MLGLIRVQDPKFAVSTFHGEFETVENEVPRHYSPDGWNMQSWVQDNIDGIRTLRVYEAIFLKSSGEPYPRFVAMSPVGAFYQTKLILKFQRNFPIGTTQYEQPVRGSVVGDVESAKNDFWYARISLFWYNSVHVCLLYNEH